MNFLLVNGERCRIRRTAASAGASSPQTVKLDKKVLVGLGLGVVFSLALQAIYSADNPVLKASIQWFNVVGNGYVQLLQLIVMPLVLPLFSAPLRACTTRRNWAK